MREDVRQAREGVHELLASEDADSKLMTVTNAVLRQAEERERNASNALVVAIERRKTAEIQLAEAKKNKAEACPRLAPDRWTGQGHSRTVRLLICAREGPVGVGGTSLAPAQLTVPRRVPGLRGHKC
jgi:hypothetical protein